MPDTPTGFFGQGTLPGMFSTGGGLTPGTMFGATSPTAPMYQPPRQMNLIRDPNNPNRAKIVWSDPQNPVGPIAPPPTNPFIMPPVSPTAPTGGGGGPTPSQPDWTTLIQTLITALTGGGQQPSTSTPPPSTAPESPQVLDQSPTPLTAPSTTTDTPSTGTDASTQLSKQTPNVSVIEDPTQIAAALAPTPVQDLSQAGKMPGLYTGGPLTVPAQDLTGLVGNYPNSGSVSVNDNPSAADIAAMGGGNLTAGLNPVTVTPSALANGGLTGSGFGTSSTEKTGSASGPDTNNLVNRAINVGGMFAPTGYGLAAGAIKGLVDQVAGGDTYNNNPFDKGGFFQSLFGSGAPLGERLVDNAAGYFSGGMPITAANDPNAQIGNQSATGSLTPGMFSGAPATAPSATFDPSLIGGNTYGSGAMSGGWMFPTMNYSMDQMGSMLDLSSLSDVMSAAKMGMGGM